MIWFDLITPKSVLFFKPLIKELKKSKEILITAREGVGYKEVIKLLELHSIPFVNRGEFGGASLEDKLKASIERQKELMEFVTQFNIEKLVCLSSVDAVRVAFGLGIAIYNFYDIPLSDHKSNFKKALPQARLTIPLATKMFKPFVVPDEIFLRFGLEKDQIIEYRFIDPLIWLKDFKPDINYLKKTIPEINFSKPIITVREEEFKSSYVKGKYPFLYDTLRKIENWDVNLIIIPRYETEPLKKEFKKAIVLEEKIILQHLLAFSDLFIGGGGTINIETTYFGVPTISTRSFISHYDKFLIDKNLMWHSNNAEEITDLSKTLIGKKTNAKEVYDKMKIDIEMLVNKIINN